MLRSESSSHKGAACPFRHSMSALSTTDVCPKFRARQCDNVNCPLRHFDDNKDRSTIPCYWESQPSGCQKALCPFLHTKPRPGMPGQASHTVRQQATAPTAPAQQRPSATSRLGVKGVASTPASAPATQPVTNTVTSRLQPAPVAVSNVSLQSPAITSASNNPEDSRSRQAAAAALLQQRHAERLAKARARAVVAGRSIPSSVSPTGSPSNSSNSTGAPPKHSSGTVRTVKPSVLSRLGVSPSTLNVVTQQQQHQQQQPSTTSSQSLSSATSRLQRPTAPNSNPTQHGGIKSQGVSLAELRQVQPSQQQKITPISTSQQSSVHISNGSSKQPARANHISSSSSTNASDASDDTPPNIKVMSLEEIRAAKQRKLAAQAPRATAAPSKKPAAAVLASAAARKPATSTNSSSPSSTVAAAKQPAAPSIAIKSLEEIRRAKAAAAQATKPAAVTTSKSPVLRQAPASSSQSKGAALASQTQPRVAPSQGPASKGQKAVAAAQPQKRPASQAASSTAPAAKKASVQQQAQPAPVTSTKPAPVTSTKPAPVTTAKPAPVTTAKPAPVTTTKPAPVTTAKPAPVTTAKPPAAAGSGPVKRPQPATTATSKESDGQPPAKRVATETKVAAAASSVETKDMKKPPAVAAKSPSISSTPNTARRSSDGSDVKKFLNEINKDLKVKDDDLLNLSDLEDLEDLGGEDVLHTEVDKDWEELSKYDDLLD